MFKKTTLAVLALTSTTLFAGGMGPVCTPGNATVPCEATAWDVGLYALYAKPSDDADWAYLSPVFNQNGHSTYKDFQYSYGWGFKLDGSYHFSTGNDFTINWTHLKETTKNNDIVGPVPTDYTEYNSIKTHWDAVNFEFAQHVDFGEHKNIRFHGGAQYVSIKQQWDESNSQNNNTEHLNVKFSGFGPRAGSDFSYDFGSGLEIYANAAGAILVGTSKFNVSTSPVVATNAGSKDAIVPELDAKLGAKYNYSLGEGLLTFDAGWMFAHYFNPLHRLREIGTINFVVPTSTVVQTDISFNGPIFGVKWLGNA